MKSKFWAYFLWFFGGIFGAHHIYLERDNQAFVWFCTLGYFGVGYIRDLFRIPTYVSEANNDQQFQNWFRTNIQEKRIPPFPILRNLGAFVLSYLWAHVFCLALPEKEVYGFNFKILYHIVPFIVALGTWFVGNISYQQGPFKHSLIAAYIFHPTLYIINDYAIWLYSMTMASVMTFDGFSKTWRHTSRKKTSFPRRMLYLSFLTLIYSSMWTSYIYFNSNLENDNDNQMKFSELVKSTLFNIYSDVKFIYASLWEEGFWKTIDRIVDSFDPTGKARAYRVLGISPTASQNEVTFQWRMLSREYHPDKVKGSKEKRRRAQEQFLMIQEAYELISISRHRRQKTKNNDVHPQEA